ncbi:hypothetical protein CP532_6658 [Ophiocordyceps camponoti-leonardi (nom. inval.)]|nr:hypothetical protein CP532_6658 [Ophiocordyceps camponoti-leonardi (nom. inval.)]
MLLAAFLTIFVFGPQHGLSNDVYPDGEVVQVLEQTFGDEGASWAERIAQRMIALHTANHQHPSLHGTWTSVVDVTRPPVSESSITESTCWRNWFTCGSVTFTRRSELINDPFPPPFAVFLSHLPPVSYEPKAKVFATRHQEFQKINHDNESVTLSIHQSTQEIEHTDSWQIVANLDQDGVIHLEKGEPLRDKKPTSQVTETLDCPPKKTCTFETWTIHATFTGYCRRRPTIQCGDDAKEICFPMNPGRYANELEGPLRIHEWGDCEQFNLFVWNNCYKQAADKFLGPIAEECEMTAPILYEGRPLSAVVSRQIASSSSNLTL